MEGTFFSKISSLEKGKVWEKTNLGARQLNEVVSGGAVIGHVCKLVMGNLETKIKK